MIYFTWNLLLHDIFGKRAWKQPWEKQIKPLLVWSFFLDPIHEP
jgi:hypothetical protein